MEDKKKRKKLNEEKEEQDNIDLRDSFYATSFRIYASSDQTHCVVDFYQEPIRDNGYYTGTRIYLDSADAKLLSKALRDTLKEPKKTKK